MFKNIERYAHSATAQTPPPPTYDPTSGPVAGADQNHIWATAPLVGTPALSFTFDSLRYPYNQPYQGTYRWKKHYYRQVGDLKASGEEFECARCIDTLDEVAHWVRNPERSSKAFSLQTATDRFYPDFVCQLTDGRYLVVEYKGEVYRTNDDSREKNSLGELWEKRSHGACLFLMVSDRQYDAIRAKINYAVEKPEVGVQ